MTDRLPIPASIKWLVYYEDSLMLVTDMLPRQLRAFDHYLKKWDALDKDTQRFLSAVVEVAWLRENDYCNADAWRKAVE
jgi:hypothetical protein